MTADAQDRVPVFVESKSAGEQATGTPVGRELPQEAQLEIVPVELTQVDGAPLTTLV